MSNKNSGYVQIQGPFSEEEVYQTLADEVIKEISFVFKNCKSLTLRLKDIFAEDGEFDYLNLKLPQSKYVVKYTIPNLNLKEFKFTNIDNSTTEDYIDIVINKKGGV